MPHHGDVVCLKWSNSGKIFLSMFINHILSFEFTICMFMNLSGLIAQLCHQVCFIFCNQLTYNSLIKSNKIMYFECYRFLYPFCGCSLLANHVKTASCVFWDILTLRISLIQLSFPCRFLLMFIPFDYSGVGKTCCRV